MRGYNFCNAESEIVCLPQIVYLQYHTCILIVDQRSESPHCPSSVYSSVLLSHFASHAFLEFLFYICRRMASTWTTSPNRFPSWWWTGRITRPDRGLRKTIASSAFWTFVQRSSNTNHHIKILQRERSVSYSCFLVQKSYCYTPGVGICI